MRGNGTERFGARRSERMRQKRSNGAQKGEIGSEDGKRRDT